MRPLRYQALFLRITSRFLRVFLLTLILIASNCSTHAQIDNGEGADLPLVEHTNVPPYATFWFLSTFDTNSFGFGPPLPWNRFSTNLDVPIYQWSGRGNSYVVDDTGLPPEEQEQYFRTPRSQTEMLTTSQDPPPVPGGDTGNGDDPGVPTPLDAYFYPSNYLWLSIEGVSNGIIYLTAHGTVSEVPYDLLSREHLTNTSWFTEGTFIGAENQDWTPLTIAVGARTNELYFWARSSADDGSGLPLWWQLKYFGHTGVNPYADPDGDGWLTIQEYQNNTDPTIPNQPPAPTGLAAVYQQGTTSVKVTWNNSQGPVLYYIVERNVLQLGQTNYFQVTAGTDVLQDNSFPLSNPDPQSLPGTYRIKAHYAVADSPWSTAVPIYRLYDPYYDGYGTPFAWIMPGQQSHAYLAMPPPQFRGGTGNLIRYYFDGPTATTLITNWVFSTDLLTNGPCQIPDFMLASDDGGYSWPLELRDSNGVQVATIFVQKPDDYGVSYWFYDAREHLHQNEAFWLRASLNNMPLTFTDTEYEFNSYPSNYVYADFHYLYESPIPSAYLYSSLPFSVNYLFRNLAFDPTAVDYFGVPTTGIVDDSDGYRFSPPIKYFFQQSTNRIVAPILSPTESQWIYSPFQDNNGIESTPSNTFTLRTDATNFDGLQMLSAKVGYFDASPATFTNIYPAGWLPYPPFGYFYSYFESAQPILQTIDYYFCQPGIHLMPGHTNFMVTNTNPPLITGLGHPSRFAGYAKQRVVNGDPSKFAYLGQYFEKAYKVSTNGTVTSQETGVISPYGDFFPPEPGQVALVTMTNFGVNERGTAVVNVISLALDANHDGIMDTRTTGPDFTSLQSPYVFWVNDDYDRPFFDKDDKTNYEDSVEVPNMPGWRGWALGWAQPVDCDHRDGAGNRIIPTTRDLEDFARLWICGLPTNVIGSLPAGTTISLSWGDVGNPNTNNPSIDLFQAADPDGGIGYLTNAATSVLQTNATSYRYVGRVSPGESLQLNTTQFPNGWAGDRFIWCGAATGTGQLTLTISVGGTNTLAQTSAYMQLAEIKQMYERWTVGDDPTVDPTNFVQIATEETVLPFQYGTPTDQTTRYILFVPGWNLTRYMKDRFAETAFKRLYWQGYRGRFGSFRWPTFYNFKGTLTQLILDMSQKDNFDRSEFQAYKSAPGLLNLLTQLHNTYGSNLYLYAVSHGNMVCGEALRLAGNTRLVTTYLASQAALTAHTYDPTVPNYSFFYPPWSLSASTPNIYGNWFAGIKGHAAGQIINFFNANDYALQRSVWQLNQLFKPDQNVAQPDHVWDFAYSGATSDGPPWTNFYKHYLSGTVSNAFIFDIVGNITHRYEVMAFAAQSWTTALGATWQGSTPGVLNNISLVVDLSQLWPPDPGAYSAHLWHSGQFRGPYWQQQNYWRALLSQQYGFNIQNQ